MSGAVNTNTPQQNAGVFFGQINIGGWDANEKASAAMSAVSGFFNIHNSVNLLNDNFEMFDGLVNDQDVKPSIGINI